MEKTKSSLTFMIKFIIFIYTSYVLIGLVYFVLTSRDNISYDLSTISAFIDIPLYSVAVWLLLKRMEAARWFVIAILCVDIILAVANLAAGSWTPVTFIGNTAINCAIIAYFAFSKKAKKVLCNEYTDENKHDVDMPKMNEFAYWRNLAMFFCIFSVVGHWMEAGFCYLISLGIVQGSVDFSNTELWRDWFYPFTIEGIGFVMCVVLLYPLKNLYQKKLHHKILPLILSFLTNMFVCSAVELVMGLIVNSDLKLWDYSPLPFNLIGQICLQNSFGFGIASTAIVWLVYPFLMRMFNKLPRLAENIVAGITVAFYLILHALYMITI
jgi:uncharacterized membrane protein